MSKLSKVRRLRTYSLFFPLKKRDKARYATCFDGGTDPLITEIMATTTAL